MIDWRTVMWVLLSLWRWTTTVAIMMEETIDGGWCEGGRHAKDHLVLMATDW